MHSSGFMILFKFENLNCDDGLFQTLFFSSLAYLIKDPIFVSCQTFLDHFAHFEHVNKLVFNRAHKHVPVAILRKLDKAD